MSTPNEGSDRIDYHETADITEVHAAVEREKPEPSADVTPIPLWLTSVCALATIWAGVYFGIFNGGLSGSVYNEYESSPAVLFPLPATNQTAWVCRRCFPPLTVTLCERVRGTVANIVLGNNPPLRSMGRPTWRVRHVNPQKPMNDEEIAAVMTFVRASLRQHPSSGVEGHRYGHGINSSVIKPLGHSRNLTHGSRRRFREIESTP